MERIIVIIPARMRSSRFPGKPLAKILGIPMIGHVYYRTKMCKFLDEVFVATCDREIYDYIVSIGGKVVMTSSRHERASDRVAEALIKIEAEQHKRYDIVVMVQGDEPMVLPEMIELAVKPMLKNSDIQVVNLMAPLKSEKEFRDPNEIKVVVDKNGFALYFSREPIPSTSRWSGKTIMFKQICIIPFRRDFLLKFSSLEATPLEKIESVDMLRILEHGYKVKMVQVDYQTYSVDTPEDLKKVEKLMKNDPLVKLYGRK